MQQKRMNPNTFSVYAVAAVAAVALLMSAALVSAQCQVKKTPSSSTSKVQATIIGQTYLQIDPSFAVADMPACVAQCTFLTAQDPGAYRLAQLVGSNCACANDSPSAAVAGAQAIPVEAERAVEPFWIAAGVKVTGTCLPGYTVSGSFSTYTCPTGGGLIDPATLGTCV